MTELQHASELRRYSFGGSLDDLRDINCWKFDAVIRKAGESDAQITTYVNCVTRGEAFAVFFAKHPEARIYGTGMPITEQQVEAESGQLFKPGEITIEIKVGFR